MARLISCWTWNMTTLLRPTRISNLTKGRDRIRLETFKRMPSSTSTTSAFLKRAKCLLTPVTSPSRSRKCSRCTFLPSLTQLRSRSFWLMASVRRPLTSSRLMYQASTSKHSPARHRLCRRFPSRRSSLRIASWQRSSLLSPTSQMVNWALPRKRRCD